tara:strand:- start:442 stop:1017 length:576 start_codon:yes stop_codon:yes gene_type:complete
MPIKKKKKKKIKKLSTSKMLYADYRAAAADLENKPRGFNKLLTIMEKDAGKGLENLDKAYYVNVFDEAGKVKTYKQLQHFIDRFIPSMTPADIALAALNHAKDKWNVVKILNDPEQKESVMKLLDHVDKNTAAKTYASIALVKFVRDTGYKRPKEITTFKGHITMFKDYFGLKRKKKKVAHFIDKEFKIDN